MSALNRYRIMWVLVMFDLPVLTAKERREANQFRKFLLNIGFERCQLSVYMRCCPGKEKIERYVRQIKDSLPNGGQVDILNFTDKQFENIISFKASAKQKKKKMEQLAFF